MLTTHPHCHPPPVHVLGLNVRRHVPPHILELPCLGSTIPLTLLVIAIFTATTVGAICKYRSKRDTVRYRRAELIEEEEEREEMEGEEHVYEET